MAAIVGVKEPQIKDGNYSENMGEKDKVHFSGTANKIGSAVPNTRFDPAAYTFCIDELACREHELKEASLRDVSAAVGIANNPELTENNPIDFHKAVFKGLQAARSKFSFNTPSHTRALDSWSRSFAEVIARDQADRVFQGHSGAHMSSSARAMGQANMELNPAHNSEIEAVNGDRFIFLKDMPTEAKTVFETHWNEFVHAGGDVMRENHKMMKELTWFQNALVAHVAAINSCLSSEDGPALDDVNGIALSAAAVLGIKTDSRQFNKLYKKIETLSTMNQGAGPYDILKEVLIKFNYDEHAANKVVDLAQHHRQQLKAWSDESEDGLSWSDKAEGKANQYEYFDHDRGEVKTCDIKTKAKIEAFRDLMMAARLSALEEVEDELAKEFEQNVGPGSMRFGGYVYNCGLYGENPIDQARQWTSLIEMKWLGNPPVDESGSRRNVPKHLYGPCGAMQVPAYQLGGIVSAVHHSSALTSLWCPHNGDFHEVDGLQGDLDTRTYAFVKKGTALYDQFKNNLKDRVIKDDVKMMDPNTLSDIEGCYVSIDCVHSQNFLYIHGTEKEMSRNLRRLWGYQDNAKAQVKVNSVSIRRDGTDTEYGLLDGNRVVGQSLMAGTQSAGLFNAQNKEHPNSFVNSGDERYKQRQDALVIEGLEFYRIEEDGTEYCVANFTQNHDDAFREPAKNGQITGFDGAVEPNYHACDDGGCTGHHATRGQLFGSVIDRVKASYEEDQLSPEVLNKTEVAEALERLYVHKRDLIEEGLKALTDAIKEDRAENLGKTYLEAGIHPDVLGKALIHIMRHRPSSTEAATGVEWYRTGKEIQSLLEEVESAQRKVLSFPVKTVLKLGERLLEIEGHEDAAGNPVNNLNDLTGLSEDGKKVRDALISQLALESSSTAGKFSEWMNATLKEWNDTVQNYFNPLTNTENEGRVLLSNTVRGINELSDALEHQKLTKQVQSELVALTRKLAEHPDAMAGLNVFTRRDAIDAKLIRALADVVDVPEQAAKLIEKNGKIARSGAEEAPKYQILPFDSQGRIDVLVPSDRNKHILARIRHGIACLDEALERQKKALATHQDIVVNQGDLDNKLVKQEVAHFKSLPAKSWNNSRQSRGVLPSGIKGAVTGSTFLSGISMALSAASAAGAAVGASVFTALQATALPFVAVLGYIGFEKMRDAHHDNRRLNQIEEVTHEKFKKITEEANGREKMYNVAAERVERLLTHDDNGVSTMACMSRCRKALKALETPLKEHKGMAAYMIHKTKALAKVLKKYEKYEANEARLRLARYAEKNDDAVLASELLKDLQSVQAELAGLNQLIQALGINHPQSTLQEVAPFRALMDSVSELNRRFDQVGTDEKGLIDCVEDANDHFHAAGLMQKINRSLLGHSYMLQQGRKNNTYSHLTGIGYLGSAGAFLGSSIISFASIAVSAFVAGALSPIGLGVLTVSYGINAYNKHREMQRLGEIKKQIEAVEPNEQEKYAPKVVGYHKALLNHIQERMEELRRERNSWVIGAGCFFAMSAAAAAATVVTGGTAGVAVGVASAAVMLGGSVPLFKETFHLFNRYSNWGSMYAARAEDSEDINDMKIDSPEDLKKAYWSKSKMLGVLGEKNLKMMQMIGNHERAQEVLASSSGQNSTEGTGNMTGQVFNLKKGGRSSVEKAKNSDIAQNTRAGTWSPDRDKFGDGIDVKGGVHSAKQHLRQLAAVTREKFLDPNFSQRELSNELAKGFNLRTETVEGSKEFLLRPEAITGMKDYVLHKINYLQHNKFKLEERIEMLSRSDGDVTSVSQKMIALELVRITQQMKGLDHCLTMMDAYQIETNQGKDGSGESLSDQERAWENLILGFVVATGAASQLLQEKGKGLRTSRPLLEEAKEKISERFLNTFSYGNGHVGKVSVNAAELLNPTDDDAKSARLALKRILFKQNPSAQIKGANRVLADSLVFVLPGLENNDILTMFERFEIPNRSDLTKVQSGRLPGSGGYVRKRGWFDKRVDKSDGEYRFSHGSILPWRRPAVADALINRLNPAQPPTPALLVN